jgi:hypothetical protein
MRLLVRVGVQPPHLLSCAHALETCYPVCVRAAETCYPVGARALAKPAICVRAPSLFPLTLPPSVSRLFFLLSLFSSKANQRAAGFIFSVRGAGTWGGAIEETRPLPTSPPPPPSMLSSASAQKHQCSKVLLVVILYGHFSRTLTFGQCSNVSKLRRGHRISCTVEGVE